MKYITLHYKDYPDLAVSVRVKDIAAVSDEESSGASIFQANGTGRWRIQESREEILAMIAEKGQDDAGPARVRPET